MAEIILNHSSNNSNTNDNVQTISPNNSNANYNAQTSFSNTSGTATNTSMIDNERQVKKSRICHPVWQYLSWDIDKALSLVIYVSKNTAVKEEFMEDDNNNDNSRHYYL